MGIICWLFDNLAKKGQESTDFSTLSVFLSVVILVLQWNKINFISFLVLPLPIYMNTQLMSGPRSSPDYTTSPRNTGGSIETTYSRYSAPNTPRDKTFSSSGECFFFSLKYDLYTRKLVYQLFDYTITLKHTFKRWFCIQNQF